MPLFGIDASFLKLLELGYGLFFGVLSFLDFKGGGCWLRLLALLADESDEEFLRFARRFIQLEKGLRRECLSRSEVSIRLVAKGGAHSVEIP